MQAKDNEKTILFSLFLPFIIIGLVTLIVGIIINNTILMLLSICNIVGSVGDIVMIIFFLKLPNDIIYIDLDDPTSFTLISCKNIISNKLCGINLVGHGLYHHDLIYPKDRRKIVISPISFLILIFIFILVIISSMM